MPRQGITQDDVADAIEALQAQDKPVSLRAIRAEHGAGSLTTIANHRRALEQERLIALQPPDRDRPVLPDRVAQACYAGTEAVWGELMDAADALEAELAATADAEIGKANALTEQAVAQRDRAEAENADLKKELARRNLELEALATEHADLQTAYTETGTELAASIARADGQAGLLAEKDHNIAQLTGDLAAAERHTQERVAELNRQLEHDRAQHARTVTKLEKRLADAERRHERLTRDLDDAQTALADARAAQAGCEASLYATQDLVDVHESRVESLEQGLATERERVNAAGETIAELEARVDAKTTEAAAQATTIATLEADRGHLEKTLAELREAHAAALDGKEEEIARLDGLLRELQAKVPPSSG